MAAPITNTIRGRLVLLTLGLLLPGFLIGAYLLWDSYRNARAAFDYQLLETARAMSLVVDRELGQAAALNRALATSPHLASGDLHAFDRQAREVEDSKDIWIVLSDEEGKQLVNTRLPFGEKLPVNTENDGLWRELRNGGTVVSNLFDSPVDQQPVISVSSPVSIGGRVRYALSFVVLPSVFNEITQNQNLPAGWNGTILDAELSIVARSSGGMGVVGRKPSTPVAGGILGSKNGVTESNNIEGVRTIVAFSTSPLYRWTFAVSVPRAQITTAITRGLAIAALGGLLLMVLGALGAIRVARSITRPVQGLVEAAQALGRGDAVVPPETSIREIDAVGESLQEAAGNLAARSVDLRASESRLRLAVQATGLGIWDVDVASGRRTWSPEFREILGLSDDVAADTRVFSECIHPDDRDWVNQHYADFLAGRTGGFYEAEFRIHRADSGDERWVVTSGRLILDDGDDGVRGSGTMMDVTERRRIEDSLRESEERFRSMADSAPALIWMTDADGKIVFLNRYHEQFFGWPVERLYGLDWRTAVYPEDRYVYRDFQDAVETRRTWRQEVRVIGADGTTRWLRCEGAPRFSGAKNEFLGYVGYNVDVTESRLAADALEKRIEERAGELAAANRQLVAQIEERERVEETLRQVQRLEAVGQLTSGVAHDFNNLLTVILGNLSFAERSVKDAPLKKRLSNMRMAAERGASLVSQLLAFSRRQRLEPKAVNLNETVAGMRELLQSSMGGTVAVDIVLDDDLWPALVDPTQIELIILNLAINARDAMDVGGLLKVETSNVTLQDEPMRPEQPVPGDYVVVSVTDSGSGMSEEIMARVFEPFFTTKEVGKGSGLGLSQVLGFAKQSGGGVRIETRRGKGTTVCVYLPRAAQDASKTRKKEPRARQPVPAMPTILLVDDDDLVREVTAAKLEEFGYKVCQASNGPSALVELEKPAPLDLLILDFAMPGMNGAEVARAARKRRPDVPLMFLTGYADLTALGEFAGEPILHKPFRDAELGKLVSGMLVKDADKSELA